MDKHFKPYNEIRSKINCKEMELMRLKEDYYNISGMSYDDVKTRGGKPIDIADKLHLIVEKEKELVAMNNYLSEIRGVHEREINKIPNENHRTILKLFYLDKCSIKQIAYCLGKTEGHTKKLKRWAIDEFRKKVIGC